MLLLARSRQATAEGARAQPKKRKCEGVQPQKATTIPSFYALCGTLAGGILGLGRPCPQKGPKHQHVDQIAEHQPEGEIDSFPGLI